ncbi:hypothetical protein BDZ89DRAFT_1057498 [Hymenopellis radicata]|nr:hypothetical protein BDZ89DRAFT_1057498 [Hymenopellis radicata]
MPKTSCRTCFHTTPCFSYGGAIALVLEPLMLAAGPPFVHVVLVEPALELDATQLEGMRIGLIDEVARVRTWEKYMEESPRWGERDAREKSFGSGLCWQLQAIIQTHSLLDS